MCLEKRIKQGPMGQLYCPGHWSLRGEWLLLPFVAAKAKALVDAKARRAEVAKTKEPAKTAELDEAEQAVAAAAQAEAAAKRAAADLAKKQILAAEATMGNRQ